MSAKAKLRLRHIEDAAQSKTATTTPRVAAVKAVASPSIAVKTAPPAPAEQIQLSQAEYGSTVGEVLQRHRIERDLTLQDIAQQLRIQRSYLDALENGDFDKLPGLTYAIGYVRSYAQLLELDAATLITDFKAEAKKLQEPTQLSFPSPAPEGKVPGGALVFVGVLLAALSYGGWYYFSTSETSVSDLTPKIPDRLAFLLEEPAIDSPAAAETAPATLQPMASAATPAPTLRAPASSTEASSTGQAAQATSDDTAPKPAADPALQANTPDTASAPGTVVAAAETAVATSATTEIPAAPSGSNAVVATGTETTPPPAPVTVPETAVSEAPPATEQIASVPASAPAPAPEAADIPDVPDMPRPEAASTGRSVAEAEAAALDTRPQSVSTASSTGPLIVISATDDSWVQVRGTDATPLLTRILRKGEEYKVPVRTGLKLFTGNAGALKISVNGAQAPSLGPFGKIARNIPLDESLLTYTVAD
jgi:cytoskeleton protein RodZ